MRTDMIKRIGFACKLVDQHGNTVQDMNYRGTTVAWLDRQTKAVAEQRLWDIMEHNIAATRRVIDLVGSWDHSLRMMRLGSDMLPVYTQATWSYFWQQPDVRNYIERELAKVGELARKQDVRLSFHPGQFTVLASESDDIVNRSIEEFEYHVEMARCMGYGKTWHDHGFKINVHISGRRGPGGIVSAIGRLSNEGRNLITIENEENKYGLDDCLTIGHDVAIVLDVHHHWVNTGEYISPTDDRIQQIESSWRGVRPTIHYSCSREDILGYHAVDVMPSMPLLLESGYKKQKLRAHSDMMWNTAVNDWALEFLEHGDIMVESKMKNLASVALHARYLETFSK